MKIVIFGLTISSSWGNGHATLWRGLCNALTRRGHHVAFFERDVPYYAAHRDLTSLLDGKLCLYSDWDTVRTDAQRHLRDADVAIVTSYCPDGLLASDLVFDSPKALRVFYDLDTPVTLARLAAGETIDYIGPRGLRDFDLVLSYTGGGALSALREHLGARNVVPLYGSVDPAIHKPVAPQPSYRADLSYLGTYAADRQAVLDVLFIQPARRMPEHRFVLGGAGYPDAFPWTPNTYFVRHLPPGEHAAFFSSSRLTLNVTRQAMARMGYCPSGRLFEAAASGAAIVTDWWEGLNEFFEPGSEILIAQNSDDTISALTRSDEDLRRIALQGRARAINEHSAARRAQDLEVILENARRATPAVTETYRAMI